MAETLVMSCDKESIPSLLSEEQQKKVRNILLQISKQTRLHKEKISNMIAYYSEEKRDDR
ncbi:MAG: hypothetical protein JW800_04575 [Candidatus Omnitrophica bacterium]|nr:hypothetical protein [Candidatus Omnitrophota bacterium]